MNKMKSRATGPNVIKLDMQSLSITHFERPRYV